MSLCFHYACASSFSVFFVVDGLPWRALPPLPIRVACQFCDRDDVDGTDCIAAVLADQLLPGQPRVRRGRPAQSNSVRHRCVSYRIAHTSPFPDGHRLAHPGRIGGTVNGCGVNAKCIPGESTVGATNVPVRRMWQNWFNLRPNGTVS